jgi:regulator of protease activity HflC (stomatin/prohibitin superfamily)
MNRLIAVLLSLPLMAALSGCNTQVPTGHIGKVRTLTGFEGKPLGPGLHTCYGRDKMHLLEVSDKQFDIPMAVLCKDQLNFKFNIGALVAVDKTKTEQINDAFENVTPAENNTITAQQLFDMYVRPVVDQEARKIVSRYKTTEIASKREEVIEGIRAASVKAIGSSLMTVKRITVNNLDFPDVITAAQEARAKRQVEVETMKAETERQLEKARGQLKVAQVDYERTLVESAMIADSNKIIGASITPEFLAWHELKVLGQAAQGPNNWGFIPYSNNAQKVLATNPAKATKLVIDAALMRKIEEARAGAKKASDQPQAEAPPKAE